MRFESDAAFGLGILIHYTAGEKKMIIVKPKKNLKNISMQ